MAKAKAPPLTSTVPGWDVTCPLSPDDCKKLTDLLQSCTDTECILESIESLGLDVTAMKAENAAQKIFAEKSKALFFPNIP